MKNRDDKVLLLFANKIKAARRQKGMSQEQLAEKASLHRTYIGMIERCEKNITLISISKIAAALDLDIKDLL